MPYVKGVVFFQVLHPWTIHQNRNIILKNYKMFLFICTNLLGDVVSASLLLLRRYVYKTIFMLSK